MSINPILIYYWRTPRPESLSRLYKKVIFRYFLLPPAKNICYILVREGNPYHPWITSDDLTFIRSLNRKIGQGIHLQRATALLAIVPAQRKP